MGEYSLCLTKEQANTDGAPFLSGCLGQASPGHRGVSTGRDVYFQTQGTLEARWVRGPVLSRSDCVLCGHDLGAAFTLPCFPSCGHFQNGSLTLSLGHPLSPGHREHFLVDSQRKVWKKTCKSKLFPGLLSRTQIQGRTL